MAVRASPLRGTHAPDVCADLFVGVVVDNFNRVQREEHGSAVTTPEQQQWADTMRAMVRMMPSKTKRPPNRDSYLGVLRRRVYILVNHSNFERFIMAVITANVALMACDFWGMQYNVPLHTLYNRALLGFSVIYWFECALKLFGLGLDGCTSAGPRTRTSRPACAL